MTMADPVRDHAGRRIHRAVLSCGTQLEFESSTFVPAAGELAPCLRHGYCAVTDRSTERRPRKRRTGRRRRTVEDVLRYLRDHPGAAPEDLRRHGFSLRLIRDATGHVPGMPGLTTMKGHA